MIRHKHTGSIGRSRVRFNRGVVTLVALYATVVSTASAQPPSLPFHYWAEKAAVCLVRGEASILALEEARGVLAFSCRGAGKPFAVMANIGAEPQRVDQSSALGPVVPIFATRGALAEIPSVIITLFDEGGVDYSNEIPPHTALVFVPVHPTER